MFVGFLRLVVSLIDVFSHFVPPDVLLRFRALAPDLPALAAFTALPELWDLEARLRSMSDFPGLQQILNFGNPPVETFGPPTVAAELARQVNEALAAVCAEHPERFPTFTAVLPMSDVDLAMTELEHAHEVLGARGVQIYTNVLGRPVSDQRYRPIFAAMAARDLPVLVHPFRTSQVPDYAEERQSEDEIWFTFGWPYESSAFAARMVFGGIFEELPHVKIVLHHFGGMIPSLAARIDLGFQQIFAGRGAANPLAERAGISGSLSSHYHRFFADTALNGHVAGLRAGYDFFGPERSVFGTDAPFSQDGGRTFVTGTLNGIDRLDLTDVERAQVLEGNATALFGLKKQPQGHASSAPTTAVN